MLFIATLPVPGRVIPNDAKIEGAVVKGEGLFKDIGCASCHIPSLPLDRRGWVYTEPNLFNPRANTRSGGPSGREVDLQSPDLPQPRLAPSSNDPSVVLVPAYTDFKLDDNGAEVMDPFLPLDAEFWNDDRTRYTVFFDPGRQKRGIAPIAEMGRSLTKGKSYTLVVDAAWRDGNGLPLKQAFRRGRGRPATTTWWPLRCSRTWPATALAGHSRSISSTGQTTVRNRKRR